MHMWTHKWVHQTNCHRLASFCITPWLAFLFCRCEGKLRKARFMFNKETKCGLPLFKYKTKNKMWNKNGDKKKIPFNIFVFFLLHVFNWYCLVVGKWKLGRLRCYFCLLSWQINRPGFSFDQRDTGLYISSYSNRVFNCDCDCTWLYVSTDVF